MNEELAKKRTQMIHIIGLLYINKIVEYMKLIWGSRKPENRV
jgi:hypothetical protein